MEIYLVFFRSTDGEWDEFLGTFAAESVKDDVSEWHTEYIKLPPKMLLGSTVMADVLYAWAGTDKPKTPKVAYVPLSQWSKHMEMREESFHE